MWMPCSGLVEWLLRRNVVSQEIRVRSDQGLERLKDFIGKEWTPLESLRLSTGLSSFELGQRLKALKLRGEVEREQRNISFHGFCTTATFYRRVHS